jgi:preprotein translocase subunit SecE
VAREADLGGFPAERAPGEVQKARRGGPFGFIAESIAELKKVEWPGQSQVIQGTVVVLVACVIVGAYLYLNDQLWQRVVQKVLLR